MQMLLPTQIQMLLPTWVKLLQNKLQELIWQTEFYLVITQTRHFDLLFAEC